MPGFVGRPAVVRGSVRLSLAKSASTRLSLETTGLGNPLSSRKSPASLVKRSTLLLQQPLMSNPGWLWQLMMHSVAPAQRHCSAKSGKRWWLVSYKSASSSGIGLANELLARTSQWNTMSELRSRLLSVPQQGSVRNTTASQCWSWTMSILSPRETSDCYASCKSEPRLPVTMTSTKSRFGTSLPSTATAYTYLRIKRWKTPCGPETSSPRTAALCKN